MLHQSRYSAGGSKLSLPAGSAAISVHAVLPKSRSHDVARRLRLWKCIQYYKPLQPVRAPLTKADEWLREYERLWDIRLARLEEMLRHPENEDSDR